MTKKYLLHAFILYAFILKRKPSRRGLGRFASPLRWPVSFCEQGWSKGTCPRGLWNEEESIERAWEQNRNQRHRLASSCGSFLGRVSLPSSSDERLPILLDPAHGPSLTVSAVSAAPAELTGAPPSVLRGPGHPASPLHGLLRVCSSVSSIPPVPARRQPCSVTSQPQHSPQGVRPCLNPSHLFPNWIHPVLASVTPGQAS